MNDQQIRLTFRNGGWVLVMTGVVLLGVIAWAIAPAIFRLTDMPPGDNQTIESYAFDLSNLQIEKELVVPAMRHRDMSPKAIDPIILTPDEISKKNNSRRDPLLVSKDLVVGVVIGNEARAYPLHFLHVHEIINDTLGGVPIAVVWHWPSGHLAVFERTIDSKIETFSNSGLCGNGGMLFYIRDNTTVGGEQLFASILNRAASGEDFSLVPIKHDLLSWKRWLIEHPNTTSIAPNAQLKKRYRKASPELYFRTEKIYFPTGPMPEDQADPKTPVIAVTIGNAQKVYSIPMLLQIADESMQVFTTIGETQIVFTVEEDPLTATVRDGRDQQIHATRSLWFTWHANHPNSKLTSLLQD
jgi:hypothetical protein